MGNLAYPKNSKQVLIVFDWKEGTNIEEEKGKGALVLLSVTYDFEEKKRVFVLYFSWFDYFLFIPLPSGCTT